MQARMLPAKACLALACLLALALVAAGAAGPASAAAQQPQQEQKDKDKDKEKQQEKKGGGLFGGFKRVTGMEKGEEKRATASAGTKGVGQEGRMVGAVSVSAADREKVERMASAMPSPQEMKAFLEEGKLSTQRKGGGS